MPDARSFALLAGLVGVAGCAADGPSEDDAAADSTAETGFLGKDGSNCAEMTTRDACVAEQWDGIEGYPVGCTWIAWQRITDIATCASEEAGECVNYYGAVDGCGDPPPLPTCGDLEPPNGLMYAEADEGFYVASWHQDACSPTPGVACDLEGADAAAQACNCLCE